MEKGSSTWGEYWTSEFSEEKHFVDHGAAMGFESIKEYTKAATRFAKSKKSGTKAFRARNGSTYIYNSKTNEFVIISKNGKIVTYYNPSAGERYFYEQFDEIGDYFLY